MVPEVVTVIFYASLRPSSLLIFRSGKLPCSAQNLKPILVIIDRAFVFITIMVDMVLFSIMILRIDLTALFQLQAAVMATMLLILVLMNGAFNLVIDIAAALEPSDCRTEIYQPSR